MFWDLIVIDINESYPLMSRSESIDVFRVTRKGFGIPYPKRIWSGSLSIHLIRIDHIKVTDDVYPVVLWVGEDGGSDHLPVLAALKRKSNVVH